MSKEFSKHDLFFAKAMEDPEKARALFKAYFPKEVQNYIDLSSAEFEHLNPRFVDDVLSGYRVCDVLYKAKSKDGIALLLCHGEHQSNSVEIMPLRSICYAIHGLLEFHEAHPKDPLPPVLSIVYYNGKKPYAHSMNPLDLFNHVPEEIRNQIFKPILIDLTQHDDEEFSKHGAIEAFEILMKHGTDKSNTKTLQIFANALHKIHGSFLRFALEYVMGCIERTQKQLFLKMVSTHEENKMIMSIAEELKQEGRQEGRQEGKQEGFQEVAKNSLLAGIDEITVAKITGFNLEKIQEIKKSLH